MLGLLHPSMYIRSIHQFSVCVPLLFFLKNDLLFFDFPLLTNLGLSEENRWLQIRSELIIEVVNYVILFLIHSTSKHTRLPFKWLPMAIIIGLGLGRHLYLAGKSAAIYLWGRCSISSGWGDATLFQFL